MKINLKDPQNGKGLGSQKRRLDLRCPWLLPYFKTTTFTGGIEIKQERAFFPPSKSKDKEVDYKILFYSFIQSEDRHIEIFGKLNEGLNTSMTPVLMSYKNEGFVLMSNGM